MSKITSCAPVFAVSSPPETAKYYVATLGFTILGSPVQEYAIVSRDGHEIHFIDRHSSQSAGDRGGAYLTVDDPDELHTELKSRGATVRYPPTNQAYGMRDFAVGDPNGYWLCFGRKL